MNILSKSDVKRKHELHITHLALGKCLASQGVGSCFSHKLEQKIIKLRSKIRRLTDELETFTALIR